jgi:uncharacterized protein (TIGR03437 family)
MLAMAICAWAQPAIRQNGVVNSASRIPPTLAGGAIARGALFTVFGVRFDSRGRTRVMVSGSGQSLDARVLSVRDEQIEAEMPDRAPLGRDTLTVEVNGVATAPSPIVVAAENPGLFSRNGLGWGPGRIENIVVGARSENSSTNPAHPGQHVAIFGTGFGNLNGLTIVVGARQIKVAMTPALHGEQKIEFAIPTRVSEGCYVPVYVLASPARASNVVTISIRSSGGSCRPGPVPLLATGSIGVAMVSRIAMKTQLGNADFFDDEAAVVFAANKDRPALSQLLLLPPEGTCTAYTSSFQEDAPLPNSISASLASLIAGRGLDAGSQLSIREAGQNRNIVRVNGVPGYYRGRLGEAGPNASRRGPRLFLNPGELHLIGSGGTEIGAFDVGFPAPLPFDWSDRESLSVVDRSKPLELHWRDAPAENLIVILATNVDEVTTAMSTALCVAGAPAGHFTVPPAILANLPASMDSAGPRYDQLLLSSIPRASSRIPAAGLEHGGVVGVYTIGRFIPFR